MHSKAKLYAALLVDVLDTAGEKEQQRILTRFRTLLQKQGDMRIASKVVQEFKKAWENKSGQPGEIVSATPLPKSLADTLFRVVKKKGYIPKETVNTDVVGGIAVFLGSEYLVDNTFTARLQRIQKAIV
jgi:F0F1-type ATP synthase delta subunit